MSMVAGMAAEDLVKTRIQKDCDDSVVLWSDMPFLNQMQCGKQGGPIGVVLTVQGS